MIKPIMRAAAVHDLSGFGKCSLTVVIPILSTMGIQVCPVPTAVLSTHTGEFENYKFIDLTSYLTDYINHWKSLNLHFDCIYTGFLGSPKQAEIISDFIKYFKEDNQLVVIDPVLGDDGKLYSSIDNNMVKEMKKLIEYADIITPNPTEACILAGENYKEGKLTIENAKEYLSKLSLLGPSNVIITSIADRTNKKIGWVAAYDKKTNSFWKTSYKKVEVNYPGTGDIFTSVLTGSLLNGYSIPASMDIAAKFVSYCIKITMAHGYPTRDGVFLEKALDKLLTTPQSFNYDAF